jgi:hypothetical protein
MARRIESASDETPAPKGAAVSDDLGILFPDQVVVAGGRTLTVREYGFIEGLRLRKTSGAFFASLLQMLEGNGGHVPSYEEAELLFAENAETVTALVAQAASPPGTKEVTVEFIESLSDEEGDRLFLAWWVANAGFFIRRAMRHVAVEMHAGRWGGAKSSTPSSAPATDASLAISPDSPSDS